MAICSVAHVEEALTYESVRQKVIAQITNKSIPFIYSEKNEFKVPRGTTGPLFICESGSIDSKVKDAVNRAKKGSVAEGFCYRTPDKKLMLRVVKGNLSGGFKLKGVSDYVIAKGADAGAIGQDTSVGDNPINLNKSKLAEFPDVLKRQQAKFDAATARLKELDAEKVKLNTAADLLKVKPDPSNAVAVEQHKKQQDQISVAKIALSAEYSEQSKIKRFAEDMIKKAAAAKTDQAKAEVVFAMDKMGGVIQELDGGAYKAMKDTREALMILGRIKDYANTVMPDNEKPRVLDVDPPKYSLTANNAFMKGGLDIKARFHLVTEFTDETVKFLKQGGINKAKFNEYVNRVKEKEPALWNQKDGQPAIHAHEIGQLLDDGYWFGLYPDPKSSGKNIQMMFPRGLKPSVLEEIRSHRQD